MLREPCDLSHCYNNGVLSVLPSGVGALKSLSRKTQDGTGRSWNFADVNTWTDDDGDERLDHRLRGLLNGSHEDGQKFLQMCRSLGLVVMQESFMVPFSNGPLLTGTVGNNVHGKCEVNEYTLRELKMARADLPTRDQMAALIAAPEATAPVAELPLSADMS